MFLPSLNHFKEEEMAYKQFDDSMGFAELAFVSSMEKNRALNLMKNINAVVDWFHRKTSLIFKNLAKIMNSNPFRGNSKVSAFLLHLWKEQTTKSKP